MQWTVSEKIFYIKMKEETTKMQDVEMRGQKKIGSVSFYNFRGNLHLHLASMRSREQLSRVNVVGGEFLLEDETDICFVRKN